jgi:hypothetical protein
MAYGYKASVFGLYSGGKLVAGFGAANPNETTEVEKRSAEHSLYLDIWSQTDPILTSWIDNLSAASVLCTTVTCPSSNVDPCWTHPTSRYELQGKH